MQQQQSTLQNTPNNSLASLLRQSQARPDVVYLPPNPEMLAITRLYLEKYELLDKCDRDLFREVIAVFNHGRGMIPTKDVSLEFVK